MDATNKCDQCGAWFMSENQKKNHIAKKHLAKTDEVTLRLAKAIYGDNSKEVAEVIAAIQEASELSMDATNKSSNVTNEPTCQWIKATNHEFCGRQPTYETEGQHLCARHYKKVTGVSLTQLLNAGDTWRDVLDKPNFADGSHKPNFAAAAQPQPDANTCPKCGGTLYYHDGFLGYEAMKCRSCDYELDLNAEANAKATAEREAQLAQPQPDAQPLPANWHDCDVAESQIKELQRERDALRAYADALAEALKRSLSWLSSYPGNGAASAYDKAQAALAAYEGSKP